MCPTTQAFSSTCSQTCFCQRKLSVAGAMNSLFPTTMAKQLICHCAIIGVLVLAEATYTKVMEIAGNFVSLSERFSDRWLQVPVGEGWEISALLVVAHGLSSRGPWLHLVSIIQGLKLVQLRKLVKVKLIYLLVEDYVRQSTSLLLSMTFDLRNSMVLLATATNSWQSILLGFQSASYSHMSTFLLKVKCNNLASAIA